MTLGVLLPGIHAQEIAHHRLRLFKRRLPPCHADQLSRLRLGKVKLPIQHHHIDRIAYLDAKHILELLWGYLATREPANRSMMHEPIIVSHPARPPCLNQPLLLVRRQNQLALIPHPRKVLAGE